MRVLGIDHIVLVCADVEASLRWWQQTFGVETERVDLWRAGEVPFPSIRLSPTALVDLVGGARTGENMDHVAIAVDLPGERLAAFAQEHALDVVGAPADLFGAQGRGRGIYVRDPDGNTVEIRTYD